MPPRPRFSTAERLTAMVMVLGTVSFGITGLLRRHSKTVDLRAARRPVYPVVERLLMVGMDLAAEQAGYGLQVTDA